MLRHQLFTSLAILCIMPGGAAMAQVRPDSLQTPGRVADKGLIDDVLRREDRQEPADEQDEDAKQIIFPEWLMIDGHPMGSVSGRGSQPNEIGMILDETRDGRGFRRFTIVQNENPATLSVRISRIFDSDETKLFADLFPAFAEYAAVIPSTQEGVELDVSFSASKTYEFQDFDDLERRAPKLYKTIGPMVERIFETRERQKQIRMKLDRAIRDRGIVPGDLNDRDDD